MARYYNDWDDDDYTPRASTEIYDLRREGRLDEARQRAEDLLRQDNTSQDVWKAYAWTLIDICKRELKQGNIDVARQISEYLSRLRFNTEYDEFAETLVKKIQQLKLSVNPFYTQIQEAKELGQNGDNDRAWGILHQLAINGNLPKEAHENYGWTIYRYLRDHINTLNSIEVRTQLRDYINLENERPSNLHSQILNFALNYSKQDENFKLVSFLRLWGPANLRDNEFEDSRGNDGKPIPSLMSRIARAVVNYSYEEIQEFVDILPRKKEEFVEMLKEQFFWKIYRSTEGGVNSSTWSLFEEYLTFFPNAPASSSHSKVLGLAERIMKENNTWRFYDFFRHWNPIKLRDADWKEEKGDNGETYKPLAVKSLKKAREAIETLSDEQVGDLQWLIDLYGIAVEKFPDDDWIIRSKALLHLRAGQLAKAKGIYKDLCLRMGEKYYIWSEFADCWKDTRVKIALLCKALSLEKNEDFIGKIRLELARLLIKAKKYGNAAVELERYKKHYTEMGWRIDAEVETLLGQCSSVSPAQEKNAAFYEENIPCAEEQAYADIPFTEMVLVDKWKNDDGKILMTFVDGDAIEFTTNKKRFPLLSNSHYGQVWKIKLYKEETVKTIPDVYSWRPPKTETIVKYIPLIIAPSETADWLTLPVKYGFIQHVNAEKKVYHIYSTDSNIVYEHFDDQKMNKGDFLKFRQYKKKVKNEVKVFFVDIKKCVEEEAITHFKSRIVAVDDVNNTKKLFHFVLGPKLISGILHYDQTALRPSVGDCIKIIYVVRQVDDKKRPGQQKKILEVLRAEATDEVNPLLFKTITGTLKIKYKYGEDEYGEDDSRFGFIGDYYVHDSILSKFHISSDCQVTAKLVYAGDGRWKVYELNKDL